jgi:thymidylate synthase (FAD)
MKVTLVQSTPNPEEHIGLLAGICYGKTESSPEQCIKRAEHCVTKGHLSTLRFAHATFLVEDISRICSHQFVRSKHLDFLQRSQRYCNEGEIESVMPDSIMSSKYHIDAWEIQNHSKWLYDKLIADGFKKEDARFVLPQGTITELLVVGNFQAWYDFIKLRSGKEAQWEIREVAHEINKQLHGIAPNIFKELPDGT